MFSTAELVGTPGTISTSDRTDFENSLNVDDILPLSIRERASDDGGPYVVGSRTDNMLASVWSNPLADHSAILNFDGNLQGSFSTEQSVPLFSDPGSWTHDLRTGTDAASITSFTETTASGWVLQNHDIRKIDGYPGPMGA